LNNRATITESEIGRDAYDHVVAEVDDPAITVVESHAVPGGSARVELHYGLIVLDHEMPTVRLRALWKDPGEFSSLIPY
jgi:hypothetical protein